MEPKNAWYYDRMVITTRILVSNGMEPGGVDRLGEQKDPNVIRTRHDDTINHVTLTRFSRLRVAPNGEDSFLR